MTKTLTTAQIRQIGSQLIPNWEAAKGEIKIKGKALYTLISIKKLIEQQLTTVEETVSALAMQFDAEPQADGSLIIPPDRRVEAGKALQEFGEELVEIEYTELVLDDSSELPLSIYEALFDFIRFED